MFQKKLCSVIVLFFIIMISACSQTGVGFIEKPNPVLLDGTQVGLLIDPNTGTVMIDGVTISDESSLSSALDVLLNSGLEVVTADFGQSSLNICAIAGVGQPENDCFGDLEGRYWAFFYKGLNDVIWTAAPINASEYQVNDGDLIAFVWTKADMDSNPIVVPDNAWVIENFF